MGWHRFASGMTPSRLLVVLISTGTKNVIDACIRCKVKRLIYTSSPSVVFDGVHGIFNADELMPYPDKVCLTWMISFLFFIGSYLFSAPD